MELDEKPKLQHQVSPKLKDDIKLEDSKTPQLESDHTPTLESDITPTLENAITPKVEENTSALKQDITKDNTPSSSVELKSEVKEEVDPPNVENPDSPEYPVIPDTNITTALASRLLLVEVDIKMEPAIEKLENVTNDEVKNDITKSIDVENIADQQIVKVEPVTEVQPELNKCDNEAVEDHPVDG